MKPVNRLALFVFAGTLALSAASEAQTFEYFGSVGPAFWGELDPDWITCSTGTMQSPVDFGHLRQRQRLDVDYGSTTGEIFDNGHTIEVETEGTNTLVLDGVVYELVQFHFHIASEHRVLGFGYDMELHLVHRSADGANAVIGVFLSRGTSSGALAPIFAQLPGEVNVKEPLDAIFNPATFLPKSRAHYRYVGSLTTPPCTEGVNWIVMTDPKTISDEDIAQFAERVHFNARLVQRSIPARPTKSRLQEGDDPR
jgi:carbonic anhydrase